jgi:hypothetical protein
MAIGYTRNAFSTQCAAGDRRVKKSLSQIYMLMSPFSIMGQHDEISDFIGGVGAWRLQPNAG